MHIEGLYFQQVIVSDYAVTQVCYFEDLVSNCSSYHFPQMFCAP